MNIIQIVSDTFRYDHMGCYGNKWIHTEHLDKFAEESVVFERAYTASFPTIPHRYDLFTGRYTFINSTWAPLPRDEIILSQLLRQAGYVTMLIGDTYHLFRDGTYYDRGFDGWLWIRGQEWDRYMTNPTKDPPERKKVMSTQYLQNVSSRQFEEDYFIAQTITAAARWLELNYDQHEKFFLHIDAFDPHEPWDPPKWYTDIYDPDWEGGDVMGSAYIPGSSKRGLTTDLTERELKHLRALYAGEVTLVDRWIGMLLQKIEDLGLLENTAVIFTSDHGTYLGEHGYLGKRDHLYEECAHVPLVIRLPDSEGVQRGRCGELVQSPELMPTILEMAEVKSPSTVQAKSLLPLMRGEESQEREIAVSSPSFIKPRLSPRIVWITITSKDWALLAAARNAPPKDELGRNVESELYDLRADPNETRNLYNEKPDVAEELRSKMFTFLRSMGAKDEVLSNWAQK